MMDLNVSANGSPAGGAQACVSASTELVVNMGAEASFADLFDASTGEMPFEKIFSPLRVRNAPRGFLSHPVLNPVHGH
jgi:hypothetical protein